MRSGHPAQDSAPMAHAAATDGLHQTFGPLVALLRGELRAAGRGRGAPPPATAAEFAHWYLATVQALEAEVAAAERHAPMARTEVELLCRVALSAATVGQAMELVREFCAALYPRAGRVQLIRRRGNAVFVLDSLREATTTASSLVDITGLFAFLQLFQWLSGGAIALRQVSIGPVKREDVLPFLRLFGAPVLAGGRDYALEFAAADLERAVVRTPGEFAGFFEVFPCALFERPTHTLAGQVAALLNAAVAQSTRAPALAEAAAALGLPPSTLRRHLAQAGTAFRTLREDALAERARAWLARGDLTVTAVGERLGFSDVAAFRRAFRRWTGQAPTTWRALAAPPVILAPPHARGRRPQPPSARRDNRA